MPDFFNEKEILDLCHSVAHEAELLAVEEFIPKIPMLIGLIGGGYIGFVWEYVLTGVVIAIVFLIYSLHSKRHRTKSVVDVLKDDLDNPWTKRKLVRQINNIVFPYTPAEVVDLSELVNSNTELKKKIINGLQEFLCQEHSYVRLDSRLQTCRVIIL
uniref:Uncharacterized protein LOC114341940 n=1 Tax=Diabrotica virgifera virgifera TaxID=50390 RepID=A0A6P7GT72_DIAVI